MILEGTTSSGAVVPVQVTADGKVVALGETGPEGPQGPEGPEGPPGPGGGEWELSGTVLRTRDPNAEVETANPLRFADEVFEYATVHGSSEATGGKLSFSTTANGAPSVTERMRIKPDGVVEMGTTGSPSGNVTSTGFSFVLGSGFVWTTTGTSSYWNTDRDTHLHFRRNGSDVGSIVWTEVVTNFNTSSDYRIKENLVDLDGAIARVKQLRPRRFNFIAAPGRTVDGFIAHETQAVVPEAVTGEKDGVDAEGNPVYQGIDQSKLVPLLTAALQEAIAKIETIEAKITTI